MNDPTPFERLQADNDDLRARLQLADERAFEQAATIARLRSALAVIAKQADTTAATFPNAPGRLDWKQVAAIARAAIAKAEAKP